MHGVEAGRYAELAEIRKDAIDLRLSEIDPSKMQYPLFVTERIETGGSIKVVDEIMRRHVTNPERQFPIAALTAHPDYQATRDEIYIGERTFHTPLHREMRVQGESVKVENFIGLRKTRYIGEAVSELDPEASQEDIRQARQEIDTLAGLLFKYLPQ